MITYEMRWAICYHLHNLKHVKNTHGGVLLLVKLHAKAWNFTKDNTPPWVFFTFFKLKNCTKSHKTSQLLMHKNNEVTTKSNVRISISKNVKKLPKQIL